MTEGNGRSVQEIWDEWEQLKQSFEDYVSCQAVVPFEERRHRWNTVVEELIELKRRPERVPPDIRPGFRPLLDVYCSPRVPSIGGLKFPADLYIALCDGQELEIHDIHVSERLTIHSFVHGTVRRLRICHSFIGSLQIAGDVRFATPIRFERSTLGGGVELAVGAEPPRWYGRIVHPVHFERCVHPVHFERCEFPNGLHVRGEADPAAALVFRRCTFGSDVTLAASVFSDFRFGECRVEGRFDARGCTCAGRTDFRNSTFEAVALFDGTRFEGPTPFRRALFRDKVSFDHTTFRCLPDFVQAVIGQPPDFDLVRIDADPGEDVLAFHREDREEAREAAGGARESEPGAAAEAVALDDPLLAHRERAARWRALWRLAEAGGNHRRALDFRAEERRARRPVDRKERRWDWLLGWASERLSDFGRRPHRALGWWVACTFVFFVVDLDWAKEPGRRIEVFVYTLHHALVVAGLRGQGLGEPAAELFGEPSAGLLALNLAQNLLSGLFLGAFVLALRNLLRPR